MSPELERFLGAYTPELAAQARRSLAWMRARLPGAVELIYETWNGLVIGFGPSERSADAIFSLVLYPRRMNLFFLRGAGLPDPAGILRGQGSRVRHIRLESAETLEDPRVEELIALALGRARAGIDPGRPPRAIVKAIAPRRRPRRPTPLARRRGTANT